MQPTPEHDERVMKIVALARGQPPAERESFLRHTCDTDPELYDEIADTLKWEERMGSFLQEHPDKLYAQVGDTGGWGSLVHFLALFGRIETFSLGR